MKPSKPTSEAQSRVSSSNPASGFSTPVPGTTPGRPRSKRSTNEDPQPAPKRPRISGVDVTQRFHSEGPPKWLTDTLDHVKDDIESTWNDQNELRANHDGLQNKHNKLRTEHDELRTEHGGLLARHGILDQTVKGYSDRCDAKTLLHDKLIEDLNQRIHLLLKADETRNSELDKLRKDFAEEATRHIATKQDVGRLKTTLSAERARCKEADQRTVKLSADVTRLDSTVAGLREELADKAVKDDAKIAELKAKSIALEADIVTFTNRADDLGNTVDIVRDSIGTLASKVQHGDKEADDAKKRLDNVESDVSSALESIPKRVTQSVAMQRQTLFAEVAISVLSHLAKQDVDYDGIIEELRTELATAASQETILACQKRCEEHIEVISLDRKRQRHTLVERVDSVRKSHDTLVKRVDKAEEDHTTLNDQIQNSWMGDWLKHGEEPLKHIKADLLNVQSKHDTFSKRQETFETQLSTIKNGPDKAVTEHQLESRDHRINLHDIKVERIETRQRSCEDAHTAFVNDTLPTLATKAETKYDKELIGAYVSHRSREEVNNALLTQKVVSEQDLEDALDALRALVLGVKDECLTSVNELASRKITVSPIVTSNISVLSYACLTQH
jgi:chromosome segregation ATPase